MNAQNNAPVAELKDRLRDALTLRGKRPVDLVAALDIPKSAISQYLSGRSKNMDSTRLYKLCLYLDVSEGWMMGFDVPIERPAEQKKSDAKISIADRIYNDNDFLSVVELLDKLSPAQLKKAKGMLNLLFEEATDEV